MAQLTKAESLEMLELRLKIYVEDSAFGTNQYNPNREISKRYELLLRKDFSAPSLDSFRPLFVLVAGMK